MSPRPDVSEERKNQIVEAAMRVFSRVGYQQARMDDIVAESGLSKGTLYWYFKNKDDIIFHTLKWMLDNEAQEYDKLAKSDGSVKSILLMVIEVTIQDMKKLEPFLPVVIEFLAMAQRANKFQEIFNTYYHRFMDSLIPLMQRGIDQGEFVGASAEDMGIAVGAMIEGTAMLKLYSPESIDLENRLRRNFAILIKGFLKTIEKE